MRPKTIVTSVISLSLTLPLAMMQPTWAGPHGGAAPHAAAPAPHAAAAPHPAAAPHIAAPAPHMAAPAPHFAAPHPAAPPHMAAQPHFAAPHPAAPPHMAAQPHFAAPAAHLAAPHAAPHAAPEAHMAASPHGAPEAHMAPRAAEPGQHAAVPPHLGNPQEARRPESPTGRMAEPSHMGEPQHMAGARPGGPEAERHMPNEAAGQKFAAQGTNRPGAEPGHAQMAPHAMAGSEGRGPAGEQAHGMSLEKAAHVSPVNGSSPARVQQEHQSALEHLQQGRGGQPPMAHENAAPSRFTPGRVGAGVVAGAAVAGLAAHQMAAQHAAGQMSGGKREGGSGPEPNNGAHALGMGQGERPVERSSSVVVPHNGPGERGMNGAQGQQAGSQRGAGARTAVHGANGPSVLHEGQRGAKGTRGLANVPLAPGHANPRPVMDARSAHPTLAGRTPGQRLSYAGGTKVFPRQGDRKSGIPGIYDPGGYVRTPQNAGTMINRQTARQQLAAMPNYQQAMASNGRNIMNNRGAWPWGLPQQSTWWNPFSWGNNGWNNGYNPDAAFWQNQYANQLAFAQLQSLYGANPWGYDPYAGMNPYAGYPYDDDGDGYYWNGWNNYADWNTWNNAYANAEPFYGGDGINNSGPFGFLSNLFGGGGGGGGGGSVDGAGGSGVGGGAGQADNNWMNNLLYFNAYSMGGNNYPVNYFAMNGYAPTPYVFIVDSGQFWQPGTGYYDTLPSGYQAPITVAVQEVVPAFAANGTITGYQPQQFYYNAFWDTKAQTYGYYDYRSKFHWLTFPGLQTYSNQYAAQ